MKVRHHELSYHFQILPRPSSKPYTQLENRLMPRSPFTIFRTFNAAYGCMRTLGFNKYDAIHYGDRYCWHKLGEAPLAIMNISSWPVTDDDILLTPAELGKELGGLSAKTVNLLLVRLGLQKNISANPFGAYWVFTETGQVYGQLFAKLSPRNLACSREIKWKCTVLPLLHRILTS